MEAETPRQLGYRWPAEWEPHAATWLSWPHNEDTWPGRLNEAIDEYIRFVEVLSDCEPVHILATTKATESAQRSIGARPNITLHAIPTDDAWIRDYGPTFLRKPFAPPAVIDWNYNAWGNKYPPYDDDNAVPKRIAELRTLRRFCPGIVLEGGSVETNGQGTLLTTTDCLLNPNRNPVLARDAIEVYLSEYLGADRVIWLSGEIAGDDTDGHIDQLARFVSPTRIVVSDEPNCDDANHKSLSLVVDDLCRTKLASGAPVEIVKLPMPRAQRIRGDRLPASYANFYIANDIVVVPSFGDSADELARAILAEHFPSRQVLSLPALNLLRGLGAFHCLSQQEPA